MYSVILLLPVKSEFNKARVVLLYFGLSIYSYDPRCPVAAPQYLGWLRACCRLGWVATQRYSPANFQENKILDADRELTSEQKEIVHFSSEGVIPTATTVPDILPLPVSYLDMTAREAREHTIKDFLRRPIVVKTGTWSSSDATETELYTANFPETLISNPMYRAKLEGFVGLRATLVVKVQVNSQPFQQGRLMLQYFPYAQYMPLRVSLVNATLQGRSGCPRADLDLSVGTEVELRIPYVSPHVYYNLITGQGSFGAIYLVVYSQLFDQASGDGTIEYTVWAHLEDVDVQYPTAANIYTGNSPNRASLAASLQHSSRTPAQLKELFTEENLSRTTDKIFAQVASELADLKEQSSPVAGSGQDAGALSTQQLIPALGEKFGIPGWISSATANIFKILGFSKPTLQGLPCESKLRGQVHMANFDGSDSSHKMALSSVNEVETRAGLAGSSMDEMDLTRVLSIPNYWDRFTWSVKNKTSDILWDNYVTPFKVKPYSDTITDIFRCTHMGYVANTHTYWRGSIVYTFKFVKTQFHSGRLRISYIPYYFNTDISEGETLDMSRAEKVIVDLRTSTEVSFTVPYRSTRPWMFCVRPENDAILGSESKLMYNAVTGIVRIEVLNQLVAANNVKDSIDVIAEVNGGPDLCFAGPTGPSYIPYAGEIKATGVEERREKERVASYTPKGNELSNNIEDKIYAQIMGENQQIPRNEAQHGMAPMAIDTHPITSNWSPEALCIGEKIMSIRQLIKRFNIWSGGGLLRGPEGTGENAIPAKTGYVVFPFSVLQAATTKTDARNLTMLDYYYFIYAFWRGSMRIKLAAEGANSVAGRRTGTRYAWTVRMFTSLQEAFKSLWDKTDAANPRGIITGLDLDIPGILNSGVSTTVIDTNVEGLVEVEFPYYNVSHISPATVVEADKVPNVDAMLKGHIPPIMATFSPRTNINNENTVIASFMRAPGDDYSLLYLVGTPPLVNIAR